VKKENLTKVPTSFLVQQLIIPYSLHFVQRSLLKPFTMPSRVPHKAMSASRRAPRCHSASPMFRLGVCGDEEELKGSSSCCCCCKRGNGCKADELLLVALFSDCGSSGGCGVKGEIDAPASLLPTRTIPTPLLLPLPPLWWL